MKIVKIIFALMLFACLLDFPYGYYQLVRFIGLILFAYLTYQNFQSENTLKAIIFIALAILFQPIVKISLGRSLWNIVDVIVGLGLLVEIFYNKDNSAKL